MEDASSTWVRRRACLIVPASAAAKLAKAPGLGADEVVIDLEDAVAPAAKDEARGALLAALADLDWGATIVSVRVNAPRTPWCHLDLLALAGVPGPLRSIVLPKVEQAGDLAFAERLLDGGEAPGAGAGKLALQALIETAAGVANVQEIAAGSPRLECLIIGYADLAVSLGRSQAGARDLRAWDGVRERVLLAARTQGLQAIDGPYLGTRADGEFAASAGWARELGFDGKWAIHPAQIPALLELFKPSAQEIEEARQVIEALEAAERGRGQGATMLDGRMLDEALRAAAARTLARGS